MKAAVLNDATWANEYGERVSDAAKDFLRKEGQGKFLADGSGYFTPSAKDFADPSKFLSAALVGHRYQWLSSTCLNASGSR